MGAMGRVKPRQVARFVLGACAAGAALGGLRVLGFGAGWPGYLAEPARAAALAATMLMGGLGAALSVRGIMKRGRAECFVSESPRAGRVPVLLLAVPILWGHELLSPWCDSRAMLLLPGEAWRWLGVPLVLLGGVLSTLSVAQLGANFSGYVTLQEGHTLVTGGLYRRLRHPRYAGIIAYSLGLALVHRAVPGVLTAALVLAALAARIRYEEALLEREFGDAWRAYAARTPRLLPGVW